MTSSLFANRHQISEHTGGANHPGGLCCNREGRFPPLKGICLHNCLPNSRNKGRRDHHAFLWTVHEHKENRTSKSSHHRKERANHSNPVQGVQGHLLTCDGQGHKEDRIVSSFKLKSDTTFGKKKKREGRTPALSLCKTR